MTAIPLTIFVVAPISGRLSDRMGSQGLSCTGALVGALGLFAMAGVFGMGRRPALAVAFSAQGECALSPVEPTPSA